MKLKNILQYIATPTRVFITTLIILCILSIFQGICIDIEETYARKKNFKDEEKSKVELNEEEQRTERIQRSKKEFLPDGTIHLIDRVEHISGERYKEQIYDVNDNLLWEGLSNERPYQYLPWSKSLGGYSKVINKRRMREIQRITPEFSRYIGIPVGSEGKNKQLWCYNPGTDYFTGYEKSVGKIGHLGSNGRINSKSEVQPFGQFGQFTAWYPSDAFNPVLLWQTKRKVYQIDFEKQNVELVFESPDSDITEMNLHAWRSLSPDSEEYVDIKKYRPLMHCETKDGKHHLILREPKEQFSFDLSHPSFVATRQEIFVRNNDSNIPPVPDLTTSSLKMVDKWIQEVRNKSWNYWTELYKLDNQGNLELVHRYDWIRPPVRDYVIQTKDPRPIIRRSVSQFSPLMYDLFVWYTERKPYIRYYDSEFRHTFFHDLIQAISYISPNSSITNWILSVLMMFFVFWHGWPRRTSWAKLIFWVIFTGLFNIAGLLTYLALNHTAIVRCVACGKRRCLAQVECVRCKAQLPAPEQGQLDLIYGL